jgi:hypothetical protein
MTARTRVEPAIMSANRRIADHLAARILQIRAVPGSMGWKMQVVEMLTDALDAAASTATGALNPDSLI